MSEDAKKQALPSRPGIVTRHFLRLIVEVDESRHWLDRIWAGLVLLGLLSAAALFGYAIPELFHRFG